MLKILLILEYSIIIICIGFLLFYIYKIFPHIFGIKNNRKDSDFKSKFQLLDEAVKSSVIYVNSNFVEQLKASGDFFQLDKEEAFELCRSRVLNTMNKNDMKDISNNLGNINSWLNDRIEFYVLKAKSNIHTLTEEL